MSRKKNPNAQKNIRAWNVFHAKCAATTVAGSVVGKICRLKRPVYFGNARNELLHLMKQIEIV